VLVPLTRTILSPSLPREVAGVPGGGSLLLCVYRRRREELRIAVHSQEKRKEGGENEDQSQAEIPIDKHY
jgi:hypothetical protein